MFFALLIRPGLFLAFVCLSSWRSKSNRLSHNASYRLSVPQTFLWFNFYLWFEFDRIQLISSNEWKKFDWWSRGNRSDWWINTTWISPDWPKEELSAWLQHPLMDNISRMLLLHNNSTTIRSVLAILPVNAAHRPRRPESTSLAPFSGKLKRKRIFPIFFRAAAAAF